MQGEAVQCRVTFGRRGDRRCRSPTPRHPSDEEQHADRAAGVPRRGHPARVAAAGERAAAPLPAGPERGAEQARARARRDPARPPPVRRPDQPPGPGAAADHGRGARGGRPAAQAAGDPGLSMRMLRVGTVNAGTSAVLVPAMHAFREPPPRDPRRDGQHPAAGDPRGAGRGRPRPRPGQRAARRRRTSRPAVDRAAARPSGGVLPQRPPVRGAGRGRARRPARRAVRGDALGLPHAPLRAPALRRRRLPATASPPTAPRWAS